MCRALASSTGSCSTSSGSTAFAGEIARLIKTERSAPNSTPPRRELRVCRFADIALFGGGKVLTECLRAFRCADPQASVGQRQATADEHHHGAEPDEPHERIEIEPHAIGAILELIAENRVEVAAPTRMDAGLGGATPLHSELALGRLKGCH